MLDTPRARDEAWDASTQSRIKPRDGSGAYDATQLPDPLGLVGQTIDGRYHVLSWVAEGGFGYVYKAEHVRWRRSVAVKLFKAVGDPEQQQALRQAFIKEGALLNDLSARTSSIVQSYDVGTWQGADGRVRLFTVLEWLEGRTLEEILRDSRDGHGEWGWSIERVIATLGPIAQALAVAHEHGVAHRDVKPSNIFLVRGAPGQSSVPKLLDFGLAKVSRAALHEGERFQTTGQGLSACTVAYAAPEQLSRAHGSTGPWTDVYSLGLVCVLLMAGKHPSGSDLDLAAITGAATDTAVRPTPRSHGVTVPDRMEAVFRKAMAVNPRDRYQNAAQFWDELVGTLQTSQPTHSTVGPSRDAEDTAKGRQRSQPAWARRIATVALSALAGASLLATLQMRDRAADNADNAGTEATNEPPVWGHGDSLQGVPTSEHPATAPGRIDPERLDSFGPLPTTAPNPHNPLSPAKTTLGRTLFWDPRLSRANDLSCASCHPLEQYGMDGRRTSVGHSSQRGKRNSLSVYNMAGAFALMWDGRFDTVEEQAAGPLMNPVEMAMTEALLVARLRSSRTYRKAFARAFPDDRDPVSVRNVGRAIGAFERQLFTPGPWDRFLEGDADALTASQKAGFNLFVDVGCPTCHFGPYVGLTMFQKLGLVKPWSNTRDRGRYELTGRDEDFMVFRVPSLRNVARTGPYFHDGSVSNLAEAVRLMAAHQLGKHLSRPQVTSIVDWLGSLTGDIDTAFVARPALPTD